MILISSGIGTASSRVESFLFSKATGKLYRRRVFWGRVEAWEQMLYVVVRNCGTTTTHNNIARLTVADLEAIDSELPRNGRTMGRSEVENETEI